MKISKIELEKIKEGDNFIEKTDQLLNAINTYKEQIAMMKKMINEAKSILKKKSLKYIDRLNIKKEINMYDGYIKDLEVQINSIYNEIIRFDYYTLCFASLFSSNDIHFQNYLLETIYKNNFNNKEIIENVFKHAMSYWLEYSERLLNIEYIKNNEKVKTDILRHMNKLKNNVYEDYEDFNKNIFPYLEFIIREYFSIINKNPKLECRGSLPNFIKSIIKENKIKETDNHYKEIITLNSIVTYLYNSNNGKTGVAYGLNLRNTTLHGRFDEIDDNYAEELFITVLIVLNIISQAELRIEHL